MTIDGQPPISPWARDRELFHAKIVAEQRRALAPVLDDLAHTGIHVTRLSDLDTSEEELRAALPILEWLPRLENRHAKEYIVRTLTVKWAKKAALPVLVEEYRRVDDLTSSGLRWAIGNALEVMVDESIADDLMEFVREPKYGRTRDMVVLALGKIKNPRAVDVLIEALNDEDTVGPAIRAHRRGARLDRGPGAQWRRSGGAGRGEWREGRDERPNRAEQPADDLGRRRNVEQRLTLCLP